MGTTLKFLSEKAVRKCTFGNADYDLSATQRELESWRKLAQSRLADQEAIERHVTKRVVGECAEIITEWPYRCVAAAEAIRKKYGVE